MNEIFKENFLMHGDKDNLITLYINPKWINFYKD